MKSFLKSSTLFQRFRALRQGYANRWLNFALAWILIVIGSVAWQSMTDFPDLTVGRLIAVWALYIVALVYLRFCHVRLHKRATWMLAFVFLLSLALITNANRTIYLWAFRLVWFGFFVWIYDLGLLAGRSPDDQKILPHVCRALFYYPFQFVGKFFQSLLCLSDKTKKSKKVVRAIALVLLGLLIAIIPTLFVIILLSYDEQFHSLIQNIVGRIFTFDGSWEPFWDAMFYLLGGTFFAMFFFSALFGVQKKHAAIKTTEKPRTIESPPKMPRLLLCTAVTPILLVYVLFFISQWNYYLSAFTHNLPDHLTYAQYAREGFSELCSVCVINAVMLLGFHVCMKEDNHRKNDQIKRIYTVIITSFSLILIATALSKVLLYIDAYGLTPSRVYASWAIVVLAFVFLVTLLRQFFQRIPIMRVIIVGVICLFALIAIPNVDGFIANYNVNAYLSGDLSTVDMETLNDLDYAAIPATIRLENHLKEKAIRTEYEEELLEKCDKNIYYESSYVHNHYSPLNFSIPMAQAKRCLDERDAAH